MNIKQESFKVKKLTEDDILEILIEKFYDDECANLLSAKGTLLGEVGKDLRFIGVYTTEDNWEMLSKIDVHEIDRTTEFNGDHNIFTSQK